MTEEFSADYWKDQAVKLDPTDDVRHVDYAQFVADQCGNAVRYVPRVGWFRWTGRIWEEAGDDGAALNTVTTAAMKLGEYAGRAGSGTLLKAASKMLVNDVRSRIVKEMQVLACLRGDVDEMDQHRHLLTFRNGTVDLRTGELKDHDPTDMITQMAPVEYVADAACPRWEQFVTEIFPGDEELQTYYQTWLGYCITGEVRDHALGVWYGENGRNGKGTTVRTMQSVFGPHLIKEVEFSLWEYTRGVQPHTEKIAALRSARMVVAQEGNPGTAMNTALLKNFSGGDRISTRHLHGKEFSFDPKFKIVLCSNYLPEFSTGGAALWSRTKAILFAESFADRVDIDLEPTIQGPEREGVAAWVVRGAVEYYRQGRLQDPASVVQATEHHRDEVDPLKPLLGELFDYDPESEVKRSLFNGELKSWREANGESAGGKFSPSMVKRLLMSRGVEEVRRKGVGWVYRGIYLMSDPPKPAAPVGDGPPRVLPVSV